jgi:hypothetical protein
MTKTCRTCSNEVRGDDAVVIVIFKQKAKFETAVGDLVRVQLDFGNVDMEILKRLAGRKLASHREKLTMTRANIQIYARSDIY